jgi:hypothetical protein
MQSGEIKFMSNSNGRWNGTTFNISPETIELCHCRKCGLKKTPFELNLSEHTGRGRSNYNYCSVNFECYDCKEMSHNKSKARSKFGKLAKHLPMELIELQAVSYSIKDFDHNGYRVMQQLVTDFVKKNIPKKSKKSKHFDLCKRCNKTKKHDSQLYCLKCKKEANDLIYKILTNTI